MSEQVTFSKGLAGVIADATTLCLINGEQGKLYYRGYSIYDIASNQATFGEVAHLLLKGALPTQSELEAFSAQLQARRSCPEALIKLVTALPADAHPMAALQTAVAALATYSDVQGDDREANVSRAIDLVAKLPTLVAAYARSSEGKSPVAPRDDLNHAANFLYMVNGEAPSEQAARTFEVALILHMEHSFNASTFTGRVVASTLCTMYSAVSAAVGALSGPLHGGANERVLNMVAEIGTPDKAEAFVENILANKGRVMGMGHRVYKAKDPRSVILEEMLADLVQKSGKSNDFEILKKVENVMRAAMEKKGKDVWPNVDFFSGALYALLGIAPKHFTPIFAIARVVGWTAHILELWEDNRIYRPRAHYEGEIDRTWTPVGDRG